MINYCLHFLCRSHPIQIEFQDQEIQSHNAGNSHRPVDREASQSSKIHTYRKNDKLLDSRIVFQNILPLKQFECKVELINEHEFSCLPLLCLLPSSLHELHKHVKPDGICASSEARISDCHYKESHYQYQIFTYFLRYTVKP